MTTSDADPDAARERLDELARQARDGDRDALEALLSEIRPRVLSACRGVLPYNGDAEDACQEALLNIATKIDRWNGQGHFGSWAHVVAVNAARSTYRRMRNQAIASGAAGDPASPRLDQPDPRTTSVIAGTRLDLLEAMERIDEDHPQYVEPLLLRDVYGMAYNEIAELLDTPLGTVKARIHHGRQLARPLLRESTL